MKMIKKTRLSALKSRRELQKMIGFSNEYFSLMNTSSHYQEN